MTTDCDLLPGSLIWQVATCSPGSSAAENTLNTLRYAQRVKDFTSKGEGERYARRGAMPIIGNSSPSISPSEMSHRRNMAHPSSTAARSGTPPPGARYGAGPNKEGERSDRSPPPQLSAPPSTRARTPPPGGKPPGGMLSLIHI